MTEVTTLNHDIYSMSRRLNDYAMDMQKCPSANIQGWRDADKVRYASYLDAMEAYLNWFQGQPEVDRPESHPTEYQENDEFRFGHPEVENQMINDLVHALWSTKYELLHCQSSRLANRLLTFDEERLNSEIERMRKYFDDYIDKFTPLDLPESSPEEPATTAGRRGTRTS